MKNQIKQLIDWWKKEMEVGRHEELQDYKEYRTLKIRAQETYKELVEARSELERANLYLDAVIGPCLSYTVSSRVCERGTPGCEVYHSILYKTE